MALESFIDRHKGGERALLVHVDFFQIDQLNDIHEFKELALAVQLEILAIEQLKRNTALPKYFIGKGKAAELAELVNSLSIDVVIFNHQLTPAQGRNLEMLFQCKVIDRTELILDIFAARARSFEGKLQVELAQLEHLKTRLVRGWTHLERQKGGIGLRGPGETQLETDRRLLNNRIKTIKNRLAKVAQSRKQSRQARKKADVFTISLVGYTNAGKSTLFNALTSADVYVADQLFATLDSTLRKINLPQVGEVVIADTVGFIHDLPHDLIAAFKSTLEEAVQADLLLHVIDISAPNKQQLISDVNSVLHEIDASQVPAVLVYNKIDRMDELSPQVDLDAYGYPNRVFLSAMAGEGVELLRQAIRSFLLRDVVVKDILLLPTQGKVRAKLYELGVVKAEQINDEGQWVISVEMAQRDYQHYIESEDKF